MFLETLLTNNPELVEYSIYLHKKGLIQPDTYVFDNDRIIQNYHFINNKAKEYNIETFVMTKQFGRHPTLIKELSSQGAEFVAVDFREAQKIIQCNAKLSHVGHLVQIPIKMIPHILQHKPRFVTVYSLEQVHHINEYAKSQNFVQDIFIRVVKTCYEGQYSQMYSNEEIFNFAKKLKQYSNINLVGITSFPCFLFENNQIKVTDNVKEIQQTTEYLNSQGFNIKIKNMPSHNNYGAIPLISQSGGTQIEPGHALTGTCPYHKIYTHEEKISMVYVSEISHNVDNVSYMYGGGYYRRSNWEKVCDSKKEQYSIVTPEPTSIDYTIGINGKIPVGETILSSFRTQVFVTRSNIALVSGLSNNNPKLLNKEELYG